uniref:SAM domain and HD domain-containing protein 1 n=2 Tax=Lygus hesperus TaxID=30085 RepID=A0A0A9WQH0_LYGHE
MKRARPQVSSGMDTFTDDDSDDIGSDTESSCCIEMGVPPGVVIADSVHNTIRLPQICLDVIDTPEFQRLRTVKQCGVCNLVYPSATHSRFEHSIGVCHWAQVFLRNCGASISNDKKLCVLLAGLCHDLGHGPFSHLWERFLMARGIKWKHEPNSAIIFKHLVETNGLGPVFKKYGLEEEHVDFICRLIEGEVPEHEDNFFLYEIIANKDNGLDVDKFEYIMRDAKQFGQAFTLDINRIIDHVGIVEKDGVKYIGFRDKIKDALLDVFVYRAKLHRDCYQHRTCKAVELMLIDALIAADEYFQIAWEEPDSTGMVVVRSCKLSECHKHPEAFLKATDCLFQDLLNSTSPELRKSRMILEAMGKRDLYTLLFMEDLEQGPEQNKMESDMVARLTESFGSQYNCEFRSCFVKFSIGEGGDPLSKVKFFNKRQPSVPINIKSKNPSSKMTTIFRSC